MNNANAINNTSVSFAAIRAEVKKRTTRGAWSHGVEAYALDLVDTLDEAITGGYFAVEDLAAPKLLDRCLLNGADDWSAYSWGRLVPLL